MWGKWSQIRDINLCFCCSCALKTNPTTLFSLAPSGWDSFYPWGLLYLQEHILHIAQNLYSRPLEFVGVTFRNQPWIAKNSEEAAGKLRRQRSGPTPQLLSSALPPLPLPDWNGGDMLEGGSAHPLPSHSSALLPFLLDKNSGNAVRCSRKIKGFTEHAELNLDCRCLFD